jgi:hypothetical protein
MPLWLAVAALPKTKSVTELGSNDHHWDRAHGELRGVGMAPGFLGGLRELEDHGNRGLVRQAPLGTHCPVTDRCEGGFRLGWTCAGASNARRENRRKPTKPPDPWSGIRPASRI